MLGHWNLPFLAVVENSEAIIMWMNLDKLVEEERQLNHLYPGLPPYM